MPSTVGRHARLSSDDEGDQDARSEAGFSEFEPPEASAGVCEEISRRKVYCGEDYATATKFASKTVSAALFMFFATLFSTVALGAHLQQATGGRIGLAEYLVMNSASGFAHAILGAQPLLVLRPTGPITAILGKLSTLADSIEVDFFALLAATGVCVSINMFIIAYCRLSGPAKRFTPFTLEIFTCFVCSIYLHDGISDVYRRFNVENTVEGFAVSLLDANLAILTFALAVKLGNARSWRCLTPAIRGWITDYAVTIAVVAGTLTSHAAFHEQVVQTILRIHLPEELSPTCVLTSGGGGGPSQYTLGVTNPDVHTPGIELDELSSELHHDAASLLPHIHFSTPSCLGAEAPSLLGGPSSHKYEHTSRPWLFWGPSLLGEGAGPVWLAAFIAAVPISFFFYMDQNISRLACETCQGSKARGGSYQHASFVALGVLNGIGPALGLPFVTGSLPHSPQLVKALTILKPDGKTVEKVAESRVAPALVYLMIGLPLLAPSLVKALPEAVIDGVLTYVGYEGIIATTLFERLLLIFTPKSEYPPNLGRPSGLRARSMRRYTLLQIALFGLCWAVNLSPLGLGVAFVVVSLVPLRERLLPKIFSAAELAILDVAASTSISTAARRYFDDGKAAKAAAKAGLGSAKNLHGAQVELNINVLFPALGPPQTPGGDGGAAPAGGAEGESSLSQGMMD